MIRAWPLILLVLLVPASALSDTSDLEGGVFIAHHPPGLQYSAGEDYCQRWFQDLGIDSCSEQSNRIDLDGNQGQSSVWFVIAAWDEAKEWCGAEFGFAAYDSTIYLFQQWGPCPASALSIPTPGWPGPNRGVAISLPDTTWSGNFLPIYWFGGYAYYEGEIPLAVNPSSEFGGTANCEMPPQAWAATSFGAMGIFADGVSACPEELGQGDGGLYGGEGESGGEGDGPGGIPDAPYIPPRIPSATVSVYIDPSAIAFGDRSLARPVESVDFSLPALRERLIDVGAQTIIPAYPRTSLADTLGRDTNKRIVRLPDVSSFYYLAFQDPDAAVRAIPSLIRTPGIRLAEVISAGPGELDFPNDRYFESWMPDSSHSDYQHDPQWHLQNNGARYMWQCGSAVANVDIKAQGAWSLGLGDSTTVIGIVDTGILDSHEDLRVVPALYAPPDSFTTWPTCDWCWTHGTRMAGIAAARTNNDSVGVASICGDCTLLDIESACCCDQPQNDRCDCIAWLPWVYPDWSANIEGARRLNMQPYVLRVLNLSFGKILPHWLETQYLSILWRAFASNIVIVTSAGDQNTTTPMTHAMANVPFVLGVGGVNWKGEFWDMGHTCYTGYPHDAGLKGTTVGFSDTTAFAGPSARSCDVCAPASGEYVVPEPVINGSLSGYYWHTTGMNSGASAQGAGLAGLVQSLARTRYGGDICADDVAGIIEATATPWPTGTAHPSNYADCLDCPAEYFGNGILNAEGAAALVTDYGECWRSVSDSSMCQWVARKNPVYHGGPDIPDRWHYTIVDSAALLDTMWVEYKAEAKVWIPRIGEGGSWPPPDRDHENALPERMAWVRRLSDSTNTFSSYSPLMATRLFMMRAGMTHCQMSVIDQATGITTISGYTYAYRYPANGGPLIPIVGEDDVRMAYVVMCGCYPTGVEEREGGEGSSVLALATESCPSRAVVSLRLETVRAGRMRVDVFDVAGRCVRSLDLGQLEGGVHHVTWDGKSTGGARAPAGVYWVQATLNDLARTKRVVLLGE